MKVRISTISSVTSNKKDVPFIRIKGVWLEKLGFTTGKKMIIEESHGKLIIKLVTIIEE